MATAQLAVLLDVVSRATVAALTTRYSPSSELFLPEFSPVVLPWENMVPPWINPFCGSPEVPSADVAGLLQEFSELQVL